MLDAIFDSAPIGIGFWDRDLRSVRVNDALAEMTGFPAADHFGKRIDEILTGREAGTVESWKRIIRTGQPVAPAEIVSETPARPGEKSCWLERWYPVKTGEEVIGLAATFMDVTDRRRVQALLEAVLDQMPSGVYVGDASSGKLIMENRRGRESARALHIRDEWFRGLREIWCPASGRDTLQARGIPLGPGSPSGRIIEEQRDDLPSR